MTVKIATTPIAFHSGHTETQISFLNSLDQYHLKPLRGNMELKGALDKYNLVYNIYLFVSSSIENFKINQFWNF